MDIKEMNVWGLTQAIYDIIENGFSYDEETGEVYFTADDLDTLNETLDKKINGICGFIKFADSKLNSLKERKKEIDATEQAWILKQLKESGAITKSVDVAKHLGKIGIEAIANQSCDKLIQIMREMIERDF